MDTMPIIDTALKARTSLHGYTRLLEYTSREATEAYNNDNLQEYSTLRDEVRRLAGRMEFFRQELFRCEEEFIKLTGRSYATFVDAVDRRERWLHSW